jgi:hypothetical protein
MKHPSIIICFAVAVMRCFVLSHIRLAPDARYLLLPRASRNMAMPWRKSTPHASGTNSVRSGANRHHELIQLLLPLLLLLLLPLLLLLVVCPPQPKACTRLSQAPNARLGQVPASASAKHCCYYCCYYNYYNYNSSNAKATTITITTTLIMQVETQGSLKKFCKIS